MFINSFQRAVSKISEKVPLRTVLIIPFVLQIFSTVGIVGYLSFRNGQQAVSDLAIKLQREVNARIAEKINTYLEVPNLINQNNIRAFRRNFWNFNNYTSQEHQLWEQMWVPMTISLNPCPNKNSSPASKLRLICVNSEQKISAS